MKSSSTGWRTGTTIRASGSRRSALMDDVYLMNSPFTFQSMEKHSGVLRAH
jgi:hypothetical protein